MAFCVKCPLTCLDVFLGLLCVPGKFSRALKLSLLCTHAGALHFCYIDLFTFVFESVEVFSILLEPFEDLDCPRSAVTPRDLDPILVRFLTKSP